MVQSQNFTKETIQSDIIELLKDLTSDWDLELDVSFHAGTQLVNELEFESIDIVEFVVAVEELYKRRGLPFEELLMLDGRYVDEITVNDVVNFLYPHLNP
jgi:acyl carrier protein